MPVDKRRGELSAWAVPRSLGIANALLRSACYFFGMRTELDADTAQAVHALRREKGYRVSEAVNELIRRGMLAEPRPRPFVPRSQRLGIRIDVSNVVVFVRS